MITIIPHTERFYCNTPHGVGLVIAVEGSRDQNYVWTIVLQKNGKILHYQSTQITMCINHTEEINIQNILPEFPSDKLL